jgi:transcriptional regulator GlxA family with amidase domain
VGVSPHEYLVQCRLRHARRLIALDGARRSLAEIALEGGFSDQAHLTSGKMVWVWPCSGR